MSSLLSIEETKCYKFQKQNKKSVAFNYSLIIPLEADDTKVYLANILGFFMVQKEIERQIPQIQDMNQLWIEASKLMETELTV